MTFPVVFRVGEWGLPAHVVMDALAYFVGFRVYLGQRRKRGDILPSSTRWSVVVAAAVGGALGSKVLHHLASPTRLAEHWMDPGFLMGGKTIVGGLLGGVIAVESAKRWWGMKRSTGDLFVIPLCLGMAVGRVGCFLSGTRDDTVGRFTSVPWAVDFGDGPRHATALYEIVFLVVLALWLGRMGRKALAEGRVFHVFMFAYLAFRFACDFLKPYELIG
ncbi:MAG: prolipoprotein diacylglyceryl transferase, partial [Planctomycetota bacterium]|nr:prolipoprotein diacylglyceryl transferase [Planctomycetota bacterium]